jgi:hypothetical protein
MKPQTQMSMAVYKIINVQIITRSMNMKKVQYDHLSIASCGGAKIRTYFGSTG